MSSPTDSISSGEFYPPHVARLDWGIPARVSRYLKSHGLRPRNVLYNASVPALYEAALKHERGSAITSTGALVAYSGKKTGRSPSDKRIVCNEETRGPSARAPSTPPAAQQWLTLVVWRAQTRSGGARGRPTSRWYAQCEQAVLAHGAALFRARVERGLVLHLPRACPELPLHQGPALRVRRCATRAPAAAESRRPTLLAWNGPSAATRPAHAPPDALVPGFAGADPRYRIKVRVITSRAYHGQLPACHARHAPPRGPAHPAVRSPVHAQHAHPADGARAGRLRRPGVDHLQRR